MINLRQSGHEAIEKVAEALTTDGLTGDVHVDQTSVRTISSYAIVAELRLMRRGCSVVVQIAIGHGWRLFNSDEDVRIWRHGTLVRDADVVRLVVVNRINELAYIAGGL